MQIGIRHSNFSNRWLLKFACFVAGAACDERNGHSGRSTLCRRAAARAHHPQPRRVRRAPPHRHVVKHVDVVLLPERVPRPRAADGVRRGQRHQAARGAAGAAVRRDGARRRRLPRLQALPLHVSHTKTFHRREQLPDHCAVKFKCLAGHFQICDLKFQTLLEFKHFISKPYTVGIFWGGLQICL